MQIISYFRIDKFFSILYMNLLISKAIHFLLPLEVFFIIMDNFGVDSFVLITRQYFFKYLKDRLMLNGEIFNSYLQNKIFFFLWK